MADECLGLKRVAVIGVSRTAKDFSRVLFRELVRQGYDAVPVNPEAKEIEGRRCYGNVADVVPSVDWALIMTRPDGAVNAVHQCAGAGIRRVWLYRAAGKGAATDEALQACEDFRISATIGCPFMFLPGTGFPHNFHRVLKKTADVIFRRS